MKIVSTQRFSKAAIVIEQNMPETEDNFDVCIELTDGGHLPNGSVVAAFTPQDAYEMIKSLAKESGLLVDVTWQDGLVTVRRPKPNKEALRRGELSAMSHSSLLNRIIALEKKTGDL